jgi:hypothetical protein
MAISRLLRNDLEMRAWRPEGRRMATWRWMHGDLEMDAWPPGGRRMSSLEVDVEVTWGVDTRCLQCCPHPTRPPDVRHVWAASASAVPVLNVVVHFDKPPRQLVA